MELRLSETEHASFSPACPYHLDLTTHPHFNVQSALSCPFLLTSAVFTLVQALERGIWYFSDKCNSYSYRSLVEIHILVSCNNCIIILAILQNIVKHKEME